MAVIWPILLQFLMEMIVGCLAKGQTKEQIKAQIRKPGPVAQFLLENNIRNHFKITRKDWRLGKRDEIMGQVYAEAEALPDSAIETIYNEAQQTDWFA